MNKKVSVIVVLSLVALAVLGLWAMKKDSKTQTEQPSQQTAQTNEEGPKNVLPFKETDVPAQTLPEGFVVGFPLEANAVVLNNTSANTAVGLQSSRMFVSKKSVEENYKIYSDYLTKNKWKVLASVNDTSLKSISAESPKRERLDLAISKNSVSGQVQVDIVFTQPVKK
ncbi:MAG: hypothetical protein JNN11_03085 [Candidatus Doudnabacteria bacterium]|nr:hypothetical protein [Candidatus Doudnabacteria bacterium]